MNSYSNSSFRINLKSKAYIKLIVQTKYVKYKTRKSNSTSVPKYTSYSL